MRTLRMRDQSFRRRTALAALTLAAASLLASCSIFVSGPQRDEDGQVTEAVVVPTPDLLTGDCFSFLEEYPQHERVNLIPCSDEHGYIVISEGALTEASIAEAGSLQNAVSAECHEPFEVFKAGAVEGAKPTQEFLVSEETVDGEKLTNYSCVATDGVVQASE
jgi:hypothetical protein